MQQFIDETLKADVKEFVGLMKDSHYNLTLTDPRFIVSLANRTYLFNGLQKKLKVECACNTHYYKQIIAWLEDWNAKNP